LDTNKHKSINKTRYKMGKNKPCTFNKSRRSKIKYKDFGVYWSL